ncbi:uncharacterized protein FPRN_01994 [Fusarium proliferatum]|nr:uncharacterized protein FPRN_01994 [Fusarium proliferatum]
MAERDSWYDDLMQLPDAKLEQDLDALVKRYNDLESISSSRTRGPGATVTLNPTAPEFIPISSGSTVLQDSALPSIEPSSVPSTYPIASTIASTEITAQTTITSQKPNENDGNQEIKQANSPVLTRPIPSGEADEDHDDQASITSVGSATYTPQQRNDAIKRFSRAMHGKLDHGILHSVADDVSRPLVISKFRKAIKDFTEAIDVDESIKPQIQGVKMIRRLRSEIATKLHDSLVETAREEEKEERAISNIVLDDGAPLGFAEKMRNWLPETDVAVSPDHFPAHIHPSYSPIPSQVWPDDRSSVSFGEASDDRTEVGFKLQGAPSIYGQSVDPSAVLEALTNQPAFNELIRTAENCIQQYHGDKMHLIRQKTSLSLRRCYPHCGRKNTILGAVFHVGWDLKSFLAGNYPQGVHQKLGKVITITGTVQSARLCSVSQYMKWRWRHERTQLLMALEQAMLDTITASKPASFLSGISRKNKILVDQSLRVVNVSGTEHFIITIAQQLCWLAAAFQDKENSLTYAYVGFSEATQQATDLRGVPTFNIEVQLQALPEKEKSKMCWNSIIGPGVIIRGFPFPVRKHNERGLEASIPVMAQLLDLHKAVTFKGGYVFKGRYTALIPVKMFRNSIQWHVVDVYPRKLEWTDIDALCPIRLFRYAKAGFFLDTRSFIGWCPAVLETLATSDYEYDLVLYSQASVPHRWAQVDKLQIGFSQWGTVTAEVTVGKKDGYFCQRQDDYDALLDDAKNTHIILYDTVQRRATQTNAEDLILHVLHHQRNKKSKDTHPDTSYQGQDLDFAHPDRRVISTREVMLRNAERVFCHRRPFSSSEPKPCLFKHEFKSLYATIDGLWAQDYVNPKSYAMKLGLGLQPSISGWEYMDLVEPRRWMPPKSTNLTNKCGRWNEYARDIKALIFFGSGFGNILSAASPPNVCPALTSVPKGHFCLGIRVDTLERLFTVQGCLADQTRLTASGLALSGSDDLFRVNDGTPGQRCGPRRLVQFIKPRLTKGERNSLPLKTNGAVIIGGIKDSVLHKDCVSKGTRKSSGRSSKWVRLDYYASSIPMRPRPTMY